MNRSRDEDWELEFTLHGITYKGICSFEEETFYNILVISMGINNAIALRLYPEGDSEGKDRTIWKPFRQLTDVELTKEDYQIIGEAIESSLM
jgi:hypothetical protein